jgi:Homing endonuclease associated repeat/Helicase conserved C-terminal domain
MKKPLESLLWLSVARHLHAERVAESLRTAGVPSETYLSVTPWERRNQLREKLRLGAIKVLCVVDVLNEGVDLPFVECLLFLRPTESKRVFYQQLGRGLRHFVGKEFCTVIDFIGNFRNAYQIVENLGLQPYEHGESVAALASAKSYKDILNLPVGCTVDFDERIIDVFGRQFLTPASITRHNILRILILLYQKVERQLGRPPSARDMDENSVLPGDIYATAFGTWQAFIKKMRSAQ